MTIKITTEAREISVTIHDISWSDKVEELNQEMRKQAFWEHESTGCSLNSVLPCPDEIFADQLFNEIIYNNYSWDGSDLTFEVGSDDYDEEELHRVVERLNNWSSRTYLEEVRIYENDDEAGFIVAFMNDGGGEHDYYRFGYEPQEDEDEDEDEEIEPTSENNFLDDIFSPAPNVVRVTESSGNDDRDRALQAAREAAQWFSDKLGLSISDDV